MKLTIALILALQVSVCVRATPEPDKELVEKYEGLKATFIKRLVVAAEKLKEALQPLLEGSPTGSQAKEIIEELQKSPRVQSAVKIISGVASELEPVVEKGRLSLLGVYGHYLRPYVGEHLDKAIKNIQPVLDTVLPHEG
ncbi:Aminopeptidase N [Labeo rohita]|uniref:Aminopeptidase N n=1 Tax=Labeo rohita TaxID=84645 RepID=A0ABQ8LX96_LABRO|nr:apolipoprotein A-II [Labeo rohita]KAI2655264.1 Aminopeptidase N [Labeo rohita]